MTVALDRAPAPLPGVPGEPAALTPEQARTARESRYVRRVLQVGIVLAVLLQRFVIPTGDDAAGISFTLIVSYVLLIALGLRGAMRYDLTRMGLFLLGTAGCVAASYLSTWPGGDFSLTSLLLLLVLYAPWMFCVARDHVGLFEPVARVFVRLMMVLSLVGIGQMLAQLSGVWAYQDYIAAWVPQTYLNLTYNTSTPIAYASPIYRGQAFAFLEPSFLSQFCALALIVALVLKAPSWQILLLAVGIASSISGTGILLLFVGLLIVLVRRPDVVRPTHVIAGVLALGVVLASPAATILLDRRDETTTQGSSGYLRFVQPYLEVSQGLSAEPTRYLFGAGPGTSDRLLESDRNRRGEAVVYTIAPKLVFEYGLFAGMVFIAFLLVSLFRYPPVTVLSGVTFVMLFLLSGSLLQAPTIVVAWMLTSLWARAGRFRGGPAPTS